MPVDLVTDPVVPRHGRRRAALTRGAAGIVLAGVTPLAGPVRDQGQSPASVSVTFLANEGVLLSSGSTRVLIDALFIKYETGFAVPAESTQAALRHARAPFDSVDLVLVTHRHGDHFHPGPAAAHLAANPGATLLTSQQVIDSMRQVPGIARLAPRMVPRTMAPGTRRRVVVNGLPVELLGLPHGGRRHRHVEHLGYVVELAGRRILHVGDAELSEATLAPLALDTSRIDVALLPAWSLTDRGSREAIARWIRPRQVIAFHLSEGAGRREVREVQEAWPGAGVFVRSLEARSW
jgi:L-ascorbate metabolism protein UlaG (beta-lactamase superfamily)